MTKGAELDFYCILLSHVSPNTSTERMEENNHPTPFSRMDTMRHVASPTYTNTAKGTFSALFFGSLKLAISRQRTKLNAFCAPRFLPECRCKVSNYFENVPVGPATSDRVVPSDTFFIKAIGVEMFRKLSSHSFVAILQCHIGCLVGFLHLGNIKIPAISSGGKHSATLYVRALFRCSFY